MRDIAHIYLVLVVCPSITPHSSLSGHGPPISLGAQGEDHSAHTPQEMFTSFLGDPPHSPGSGLGGRCELGLTKTGQHGREVQDEQLHLWVPRPASHIPAPECPVPPPPPTWDATEQGLGVETSIKSNDGVSQGPVNLP